MKEGFNFQRGKKRGTQSKDIFVDYKRWKDLVKKEVLTRVQE